MSTASVITELNADCEIDREILRLSIISAAGSRAGEYICDLHYSPQAEREFFAIAHARTLDNNARKKDRKAHLESAAIAGGATADTVGMLGEGPVRMALQEEDWAEAFVKGDTDDRPDVLIEGVRFDVKAASRDKRSTFSVEADKYDGDYFDALILVKPLREGVVRIYVCAAVAGAWTKQRGIWTKKGRLPDYYLITMPDPAPTSARRFKGHVEALEQLHAAQAAH